MNILCFGEIIWDIYPTHSDLGGAPLNFCAHSTICGNKGYMLSAVGNDELGKITVEKIKQYGVETDFIGINSHETGKCLVSLDENGIPSYSIKSDVSYDYISYPCELENIKFDAVYFGNLALRNSASLNTLKTVLSQNSFSVRFCDINIRPGCYTENTVKFCLENADILKISDEDEVILRKFDFWKGVNENNFCNIFSAFPNLDIFILTKGSKGSEIFKKNGEHHNIPIVPCKVASTVGAGDSFSAAFLYSYLKDKDVKKAGLLGAELSSFVVSSPMAIPPYNIDLL